MSGAAGFVITPVAAAPAGPAPAAAAASAGATGATAVASTAAAQPVDFAALLLGAVFPANAAPATAAPANESSEIRGLKDLPEKLPEDAQQPIDLLFALLAPATQPPPMPKGLSAQAGLDDAPDGKPGVPTDPFAGLGLSTRLTAVVLPQVEIPEAPPPTASLAPTLPALAPVELSAARGAISLPLASISAPVADAGMPPDLSAAIDGAAPAPQFALPTSAPTPSAREAAPVPPPLANVLVRAEADPLADAAATTLRWQAAENIGTAEIRLAPKDLGKIDIDLRIEGKHLHVDFTAANADVRSALEDSLPKLRETLAAHGLHLAQADIGGQTRGDRAAAAVSTGLHGAEAEDDGAAPVVVQQRMRAGLLDEYA